MWACGCPFWGKRVGSWDVWSQCLTGCCLCWCCIWCGCTAPRTFHWWWLHSGSQKPESKFQRDLSSSYDAASSPHHANNPAGKTTTPLSRNPIINFDYEPCCEFFFLFLFLAAVLISRLRVRGMPTMENYTEKLLGPFLKPRDALIIPGDLRRPLQNPTPRHDRVYRSATEINLITAHIFDDFFIRYGWRPERKGGPIRGVKLKKVGQNSGRPWLKD